MSPTLVFHTCPSHLGALGDKCGRQVGDKCKFMRPKAPRVGEKCGRQVWETGANSCGSRQPEWEASVEDKCRRQVWETSVNSCGPSHPEWETSVGDKCKLMRPKAPRVGDKCGRQVGALGPHEFTHLSPTLVFQSGCLGPHDFTLISHLSPTLASHTCLHTCLPHLSPTLVSHTCLPLWVPWAA